MARTQRKSTTTPPNASRVSRRRAHAAPDPEQDDQDLNTQLHKMGLYAADTRGDGNCLFRYVEFACAHTHANESALSDQLYGDPKYHAQIRQETCDQLEQHPDLYAGFVETGSTYEQYVRQMRLPGTYGGHLELSAFAHLKQKRIRIVQPGFVYVVACDDDSYSARSSRARRERHRRHVLTSDTIDTPSAKKKSHIAEPECVGPLHLAYHSWEHYSSLRSLQGPHKGHPCIPDSMSESHERDAFKPDAEAERLVCLSVPGHSRRTVRRLLQEHNGAWEDVVEELIRRDADGESDTSAHSESQTSSDDENERRRKRPLRTKDRRHQTNGKDTQTNSPSPRHTTGIRELMI